MCLVFFSRKFGIDFIRVLSNALEHVELYVKTFLDISVSATWLLTLFLQCGRYFFIYLFIYFPDK